MENQSIVVYVEERVRENCRGTKEEKVYPFLPGEFKKN